MTLKQGDIVKHEDGHTRKVLGVCGEALIMSEPAEHNSGGFICTEHELRKSGCTWPEPKWEPEVGDVYWCLSNYSGVDSSTWSNDTADLKIRNTFGVYKTKEEAKKALAVAQEAINRLGE